MIKAYPVEDLIAKADADDPVTALKVTALIGGSWTRSEDDWIASALLSRVKEKVPDSEVAIHRLEHYVLRPGASNDPDSKRFVPGDQFPVLWDSIQASQVLLIATQERCMLPDSSLVRVVERLHDRYVHAAREGRDLLQHPVAVALAVTGGDGARAVAATLSNVFATYGMVLAPHGVLWWNRASGHPKDDHDLAGRLDRVADALVKQAKE